jgi:hypothetical protein
MSTNLIAPGDIIAAPKALPNTYPLEGVYP